MPIPRRVAAAATAVALTGVCGFLAFGGSSPALAATPSPTPVATASTPAADDSASVIGGGRLGALGTVVGTGPRVGAFPTTTIASFVLADATTGRVLAARQAHDPRPPASTLKTLTAMTLIPRLDLTASYKVTAADTRVAGSRVGLVSGSSYTNDQLFTALFLPSGNDAASALAHSRGSMTQSLREMNAEAKRVQALDTVAKNPSGLDADGQVSSAYDLTLIAREGLKNPDFARYASLVRASFPGKQPKKASAKRSTFAIETQNRLMRDGYAGMIGVKTGYTTKAGRTYVGAAERNGKLLIVTMMGNVEPTEVAAKRLLDWGFANADRIDAPVGTLVEPTGPTQLDGAREKDAAKAEPISATAAASGSTGGSPSTMRWAVLVVAVLAAMGLIAMASMANGSMARRRVRRRYHR